MMIRMSEKEQKELSDGIHDYFNEYDPSVGIFGLSKIDKDFIEQFKEDFESIEIVSYGYSEIEFKASGETFIVQFSRSYDKWRLVKEI